MFYLKFKYLAIISGIIIIFFLLILVLLPAITLGPTVAASFRSATWPMFILLILIMAGVTVFFLFNYRLLSLLEREDWPALAYYLEQKIYGKGRYSSRKVRLLATSYLVMTDYPGVLRLESKVSIAKPLIVEKNILIFGAARILSGNHSEAAAFFNTHLQRDSGHHKKGKIKEEQWLRWFYGFTQMLCGAFTQAEQEFSSLAISSPDALITGLSSYFLFNTLAKHSLKPAECRAVAGNGRERVKNVLINNEGWKKETEKTKNEVHTTIIMKYINEAGEWLFK